MLKKLAGFAVPLIVAVFLIGLMAGCGSSSNSGKASTSPSSSSTTSSSTSQKPIDYSKSAHWLSLPSSPEKTVDVFFLYPSSYEKANANDPGICAIDNPSMLKNSKLAFGRDATAFETVGNIYAPYYRQSDVSVLSLPQAEQVKVIGGIPTSDSVAAFDYYIKHYNKGRPFILAGHSQGSNVLINLLAGYMKKNPRVYKRMIAAYVFGYSVTPDYLARNPHLKFADGPDDTGVIISYNTEAPVVEGTNPVVLSGALAINPITWTRGETLATAEQNLGSIEINKDGSVVLNAEGKIVPVKNVADARVDKAKGVVICSSADVVPLSPGNQTFPKGVYHSFDYPFYYFDIRANAANRVAHFLNK